MKGRVLIVENDAEIRRRLCAGLARAGYTAVACPDGIAAIHELNKARESGAAFDGLVTSVFLPDIGGLRLLQVVRRMHPGLPVVVITAFGDRAIEQAVLAQNNAAYIEKPLKVEDLAKKLQGLAVGTTRAERTAAPAAPRPTPAAGKPGGAYFMIRISDPAHSLAALAQLRAIEGVPSCEAVYGDADIILRAQTPAAEGVRKCADRVRAVQGIEVVSLLRIEAPRLDPEVSEFIRVYEEDVRPSAPAGEHQGATSYVFMDIDPAALQKVFTTFVFIDGVVCCDAIEGGGKLVGVVVEPGAGDQLRKVIGRVSHLDGVLRVREAKVIRMVEN
ncbi:MAG: response regulator [Kiritimatiellae bacterium]|nr:response regulator [Kiritimatiellia bacterium]